MSGLAGFWPRRPRARSTRKSAGRVEQLRESIRVAAAQPDALVPRDRFVADLHDRLRREIDGATGGPNVGQRESPLRPQRRRVLKVAAGAVAAVALGAVGERALEWVGGSERGPDAPLTPESGRWTQVTTAAAVSAGQPVGFTVAGVAGVVVNEGGQLRALSAVCTHQGCLLRLDATERQLDCPCHTTAFSLSGAVLHYALRHAPPPLPHLGVRERDGQVEVLLPRM